MASVLQRENSPELQDVVCSIDSTFSEAEGSNHQEKALQFNLPVVFGLW